MFVSVIACAANQGNHVRETIPKIWKSLDGLPAEILVVDDQSTDGCCDDLGDGVTVLRHDQRLGVSRGRRFATAKAKGDVLLFTDPHCDYQDDCLKQLCEQAAGGGIYQPATISLPGQGRPRLGGHLCTSERGLRVRSQRPDVHAHPALLGTIYAMRRDVHDYLDGWPALPGVWGSSEQAMTLMAWFSGVQIHVDRRFVCNHKNYQINGKFPYHVPRGDPGANAHYVHRAFFPETYPRYWQIVLNSYYGVNSGNSEAMRSWDYRQLIELIHARKMKSKRTERMFFEKVLGSHYPEIPDGSFVKDQMRRSAPEEFIKSRLRAECTIGWLGRAMKRCRSCPNQFRTTILDLGSRDGYAIEIYKQKGAAYVLGVELVQATADYARSKGRPVRAGDMRYLPDSDSTWGIVSAIHSLEHVDDPWRVRDEMVRVVQPGGWILVAVPQETKPSQQWAHHSCWASAEHLKRFMLENPLVDQTMIFTRKIPMKHSSQMELRVACRKKR